MWASTGAGLLRETVTLNDFKSKIYYYFLRFYVIFMAEINFHTL